MVELLVPTAYFNANSVIAQRATIVRWSMNARMRWTRNGYLPVTEDGRVIDINELNRIIKENEELKQRVNQLEYDMVEVKREIHDILVGMRYSE